ncbi:adhesion G protein-coupled receptor E3, partial [Biomphalaria glabrata]
VNETLKIISDAYSYQLDVVYEVNNNVSDKRTLALWADMYVLASMLLTRDSFENIALDIFFGSTMDQEGNTFLYYNYWTEAIYNNYKVMKGTSVPERVTVLFQIKYNTSLTSDSHRSISLSRTLTCSFLTFKNSSFTVEWNQRKRLEHVMLTLDVGGITLIISNMSDINSMVLTENNELNICTDILDKYINKTRSRGINRPMDGVLYVCAYILTYICLSASELCLLITLITYLVFAELRTVPGINNIFLTLSLFLAQLALIMASNVPTPSALCTYIGIVTHFLWLWHFSWSFLCSLHMFRIFTANIPNVSSRTVALSIRTLKLMVLTMIVSASIVIVVIISSYLTSQTIGYGKKTCYLDSAFLI